MQAGRITRFGGAAAAAMAALALLMLVLVPPGFMTADIGSGPALVICTGHGPLDVQTFIKGGPVKPQKQSPSQACSFSGRSGAAPTSLSPLISAEFVTFRPEPNPAAIDLHPGRGLAAPPPPSHGPPSQPI